MSASKAFSGNEGSIADAARRLLGRAGTNEDTSIDPEKAEKLDLISNSRYDQEMSQRKRGMIRVALKRALRESGWSLKKLSEESGVAYASTHGFFTRDAASCVESIERWCRALGLVLGPKGDR